MGEKAMKEKVITKVLSCLVVFAILMSVFSVAVIATNSSNSTASNVNLNLNDEANSSVESVALSNNITCLTCRDDLIQINKTETVVNESGNSDLPDASNNTYAKLELEYANTSSPEIINESDEVPDPDLPVINDTDIDATKTVSSTSSCDYVWIKITDKYCKGYKVYVDGVYQFTEGGAGGVLDGYCCFKVTPGYHTFKLTLDGKQVSKGWNCQCGVVYNWMSMNDMIPHWCEDDGGNCDNPPTVNFDKSTYYEGDTVHITVHNPISGQVVDYEIIDCEGNSKESKALPYGTSSIYYTLPTVSSCCYWKICFYWNEGQPPLGAGSYCSKCYSFYVCPHETSCKVWVSVEDKYCKGYGVYVDGVYQFTEGESGTPDGYCRFWVTPGTHKFELRKDGCSVSKSWYCQCGTSYRWISMNDMDPHWCDCNKKKPDLVVQDIWWSPSNPKQGDTVTINVKTKNQGSGNVGGFYVCYYVDGSYYDRDYVSSLSAGSTTTTSFTWTADCGSHSIKAVADCYDAITESNEGNNARTEYINIVCKPDLITQDIYWSPSNPKEGDTVTFSVKTKNQGSESAGGFYICYYVDGSYYDRDYVSSLSAGSTTTTSFSWTADCGSHSIKAVADCYSDVEESNEGNNVRTEYINIVCKPDLVVQDIFWSPSNPKQGDTVTVNVKTKNQGSESAGGFYVCYYVDGSYYTRDYVSSLSAGSTTTTSFSWTADCGSHSIKAVADCYSDVEESNEGNNARTEYINIVCKPDLVVQDIFWSPSNPKQGDTVTVNVKTKNQGSESAGGFYVCYYVDGSYYARDYVGSLSDGSTTTTSFSWTADCGNHAIKAVADCYDAVAESDEKNNWRSKGGLNIPCKPDLIVQDISWDKGSPKRDDTMTFYVKVKNQGSGSAGTSTVKYYIDGSYVTSDSVPSLSAGSTSTQTFTWKGNKCGNVQVKAVADATNAVDESNEWNNQRIETVNIGCPKIPAFESKGIYVWGFSTEFFKNENERERFFNLIKNDGTKTAFLSIDESLFADPACKEFVKEANENLQVHAMIGANWSAGDADKIDPFVRAVLKYNAENPDYMFSGIHLDAEPGDYPLKDFLGEYKEKLIDMKTRLNYNGETISSQKMALSIDVGCWWANEPNDLKDLIGVPDLDYITIMAYRDDATDIIELANKVTSIAQEKGKPFVISLETQEFKGILEDGNFKPEQPKKVTFFEEGQCELQQELEKLEENYKDDELFKGFAIHYYQSSFTPWHIITDVIWPSGEFNIGDSVKVIVKLRTSVSTI